MNLLTNDYNNCTDINGKSMLLALQAHNQKTDEYDGKKNQNQNKIISIFL